MNTLKKIFGRAFRRKNTGAPLLSSTVGMSGEEVSKLTESVVQDIYNCRSLQTPVYIVWRIDAVLSGVHGESLEAKKQALSTIAEGLSQLDWPTMEQLLAPAVTSMIQTMSKFHTTREEVQSQWLVILSAVRKYHVDVEIAAPQGQD